MRTNSKPRQNTFFKKALQKKDIIQLSDMNFKINCV